MSVILPWSSGSHLEPACPDSLFGASLCHTVPCLCHGWSWDEATLGHPFLRDEQLNPLLLVLPSPSPSISEHHKLLLLSGSSSCSLVRGPLLQSNISSCFLGCRSLPPRSHVTLRVWETDKQCLLIREENAIQEFRLSQIPP